MQTRRLVICSFCVWIGLGLAAPPAPQAQTGPALPAKRPLTFPIISGPAGGKALKCLVPYGPLAGVAAVAFSPDGKLLATGGYQEVLIWDLADARPAQENRPRADKQSGPGPGLSQGRTVAGCRGGNSGRARRSEGRPRNGRPRGNGLL